MTTTFNWSIAQMQCLAQADGQTNVVITAMWKCEGKQEKDGQVFNGASSGSSNFTLDPSSSFTPYDQLTQEQVLGWVWQEEGLKQLTEDNVAAQVDRLANPPVVNPPLPWAPAR